MKKHKNKISKTTTSDGWDVSIATTFEEVENIRSIWEQMQSNEPYPSIDADIDRYLSVVDAIDGNFQPYIMTFSHNNKPEMMVIARVGKSPLYFRLGYKSLFYYQLKFLTVVNGGILGKLTAETCSNIILKLMEALHRGEADVLQFLSLKTDSLMCKLVRKMPIFLCRDYLPKTKPHLRIAIPENFEQFLRDCSKNRRKHINRYIRRIEQQYPGRVKNVTYTNERDLDEVIRAASKTSSNTYQRGMNQGFVNDSRIRKLLTVAARKHWLRFDILYIDDEPCAFRWALNYKNICFGGQTGYAPKWKDFNVGTLLFLKVMESLSNDPNICFYDFGIGGGKHKEWGNYHRWHETSCLIFAPRLYPIFLNMLRTCIRALELALEYFIRKTGIKSWIKRCWRQRLADRASKNYEKNR